jgi:low affinity Fe/Cu permease
MEQPLSAWGKFCAAFGRAAAHAASWVGTAWAFVFAVGLVLMWATTGPYFHYSNTWQLVINTGTTIITFLMVFLIQNTQNRDARALHLKLDEVIRSLKSAHNDMINIEKLSDDELAALAKKYDAIREEFESRKTAKVA